MEGRIFFCILILELRFFGLGVFIDLESIVVPKPEYIRRSAPPGDGGGAFFFVNSNPGTKFFGLGVLIDLEVYDGAQNGICTRKKIYPPHCLFLHLQQLFRT